MAPRTQTVVLIQSNVVLVVGIVTGSNHIINILNLENVYNLNCWTCILVYSDSDCQSELVCGINNCQTYHPKADKTSDCCMYEPEEPMSTYVEKNKLSKQNYLKFES